MGVSHLIVAGLDGAFNKDWKSHKAAGWVAVVFVWIYEVNFGYSWGVSFSTFNLCTLFADTFNSLAHGSLFRKFSPSVYEPRESQSVPRPTGSTTLP